MNPQEPSIAWFPVLLLIIGFLVVVALIAVFAFVLLRLGRLSQRLWLLEQELKLLVEQQGRNEAGGDGTVETRVREGR